MWRKATVRATGIILACARLAAPAGADDGPELTPPADLPPALEAAPLPGNGPVMALPGLTTPPARSPRPAIETTSPPVVDSLPPLDGPAEMQHLPATPAPTTRHEILSRPSGRG